MSSDGRPLAALEEDWQRALVVVAHPDDMEYGGASAVARWTGQGKEITYLLVTRGEAGIETLSPDVAAPIREQEQIASCAAVGVSDVEFLDHRDGMVTADMGLRLDLARAIRRHQPHALLSVNFRESWGGPSWNHADHRAVGVALLDAVRDAANTWLAQGLDETAWNGVRFVAFSGSPQATHYVDVSDTMEVGVASLHCHVEYLRALGDSPEQAAEFLRATARSAGDSVGVSAAATFEVIRP